MDVGSWASINGNLERGKKLLRSRLSSADSNVCKFFIDFFPFDSNFHSDSHSKSASQLQSQFHLLHRFPLAHAT